MFQYFFATGVVLLIGGVALVYYWKKTCDNYYGNCHDNGYVHVYFHKNTFDNIKALLKTQNIQYICTDTATNRITLRFSETIFNHVKMLKYKYPEIVLNVIRDTGNNMTIATNT